MSTQTVLIPPPTDPSNFDRKVSTLGFAVPLESARGYETGFLIAGDERQNLLRVFVIEGPEDSVSLREVSEVASSVTGLRALSVSADGTHVYVLGADAKVASYDFNSSAGLTLAMEEPTSAYASSRFGIADKSAFVDGTGKFLYLSDATHLRVFSIDSETGMFTLLRTQQVGTESPQQ